MGRLGSRAGYLLGIKKRSLKRKLELKEKGLRIEDEMAGVIGGMQ